MYKKDEWHSDDKIPVFGFVVEEVHPTPGTKTSTQKTEEKERFFWDSPCVSPGFLLVDSHNGDAKQIHN